MRVLISGASVAGPVLAYWLTRHGFSVTVVERAQSLRKTGGHSVDLYEPAVDISEKMGVLPRIKERATGTSRMSLHREGARRPVRVDLSKIFSATSDRHLEIMRDDLSEIYYDAACKDVEYLFGDSITTISPDGELCIHVGVGRTAGTYGARHLDGARALLLFRSERALDYDQHDVPRQKELLRGAFAGMHPEVDRWLDELDRTPAFYFDSITQLRMDTWSRERVTLGPAAPCSASPPRAHASTTP
jgi:hypothetical protein